VGVNAYVSGGTISYCFPDYQILLGRQMLNLATSVASPRIAMIPTYEPEWTFDPLGGVGAAVTFPADQGPIEVQNATLSPQEETQPLTFEVHVTGCANPPSPSFGDFDACQALLWAFRTVCLQATGAPRCRVRRGSWPSQLPDAAASLQRGQKWVGIIEFAQPVSTTPLQYVPAGTSLTYTVSTVSGGSSDDVSFTVT
jgi:hypothetical protein